jgi:NACHT domain
MRRPSAITIALVSPLLALLINLATATIRLSARWTPWIWATTMLLVLAAVVTELRGGEKPRRSGVTGPSEAADQLALAVDAKWRREEERRKVHDPFPLPVRWHAAPAALTDHWANIRRAPAGADPGPLALADELRRVADVYRGIPSGRLVVLGRAGSGKSILAVRLVLDLLADRAPGDPVPTIFNLASWNPEGAALRDWLTAQLIRDHPGLAAPSRDQGSLAAALVDSGRVLPVLDGFDEIADGLHRAALRALNDTTLPLVLTSRPQEYQAAVNACDVLTHAACVVLDDLTVDDLAGYLPRTTRKAAWEPVLAAVREHPDSPVARVLTTPLMVALARSVYSDSPGPDPAGLLAFADVDALENHLLGEFVPAVYRHALPGARRRWDAERAQRWLAFLSWHLDRLGTQRLAWWELGRGMSAWARGAAFGLTVAIVLTPVASLTSSAEVAVGLAVTLGVLDGAAVSIFGFGELKPSRVAARLRLVPALVTRHVLLGLGMGTLVGLVFGLIGWDVGVGITNGSAMAVLCTWALVVVGFEVPVDIAVAVSPGATLGTDRLKTIFQAVVLGLALPVLGLLIEGHVTWPQVPLVFLFGASLSMGVNAWGQWLVLARLWLPLRGRLPWALMAFLEDAHRRGALRQAGAVYQLRHARLQDHLARSFES